MAPAATCCSPRSALPISWRSPGTQAALKQFTADFAKISPVAHQLQSYQRNVAIFNATVNYIAQAITGTLTLPQAYAKVQEEIDNAVKK